MRLWDLSREVEPATPTPQQADLAALTFRPGGRRFLRTQGAWPDGAPFPPVEHAPRVQTWLTIEGRPEWQPFAFAPDGATVLYRHVGLIDGRYQTHFHLKAPDGTVRDLHKFRGMFKTSAAFSPSGRTVGLCNGMRTVAVWDVVESRALLDLEQSDRVNALTFVSDEHLVVAAGRSVRLWDVTAERSLFKFRAFRTFADALAVSHDRKLFAAGSRDGVVRVWDAASGREVKEYAWGVGPVNGIDFSPDGATAAVAGTSAVAIWDLD